LVVLALASAGCGRVDFGARAGALDANDRDGGDAAPFVEPIGELDPSFGTGGMALTPASPLRAEIYGILPRASGGYLAAGFHDANGGSDTHFGLFAFTDSGAPDDAFAPGGVRDVGPTTSDYAYGIAPIDATRFAITGDGDDGTGDDVTFGILDESGAADPSFGASGFVRLDVGGLMKDDTSNNVAIVDNTIVVCGSADYAAVDSHFLLARYDLFGAPVASFGLNGVVSDDFVAGHSDECQDVIGRPGGGVYATGFANGQMVVAAYDDTGARVASFGGGLGYVLIAGANGFGPGITIADDQLIVVGADDNEALVVRLTLDGDPVSTFGADGIVRIPTIDELDDVLVQPNGKIVASGLVGSDGLVVRFLANGALDDAFGTAGVVHVPAGSTTDLITLRFDAEDRLVTAGTFKGAAARSVIARLR
jgi:uncharacterized delta-60 repeat protein